MLPLGRGCVPGGRAEFFFEKKKEAGVRGRRPREKFLILRFPKNRRCLFSAFFISSKHFFHRNSSLIPYRILAKSPGDLYAHTIKSVYKAYHTSLVKTIISDLVFKKMQPASKLRKRLVTFPVRLNFCTALLPPSPCSPSQPPVFDNRNSLENIIRRFPSDNQKPVHSLFCFSGA